MKKIILLLGLVLLIGGCMPELTLQGSRVEVGDAAAVKQCKQLGSTRLTLPAMPLNLMGEEKIKEHLNIEARNFAARIGGNIILPVDAAEEGKQSFNIYNCPP